MLPWAAGSRSSSPTRPGSDAAAAFPPQTASRGHCATEKIDSWAHCEGFYTHSQETTTSPSVLCLPTWRSVKPTRLNENRLRLWMFVLYLIMWTKVSTRTQPPEDAEGRVAASWHTAAITVSHGRNCLKPRLFGVFLLSVTVLIDLDLRFWFFRCWSGFFFF